MSYCFSIFIVVAEDATDAEFLFTNDWFVTIVKPLCDWHSRQENRDDLWKRRFSK